MENKKMKGGEMMESKDLVWVIGGIVLAGVLLVLIFGNITGAAITYSTKKPTEASYSKSEIDSMMNKIMDKLNLIEKKVYEIANNQLNVSSGKEILSLSSDNSKVSFSVGGKEYVAYLVSASDTSATIKILEVKSGKSEVKEINEGATKKILDLAIKVLDADEYNLGFKAVIEIEGSVSSGGCSDNMLCAEIYKVTAIENDTDGYFSDYVELVNLKTGEVIKTRTPSSEGKTSITIGGREYPVRYYDREERPPYREAYIQILYPDGIGAIATVLKGEYVVLNYQK